MNQDYKDRLSVFRSHGVEYLLVGGFAVIMVNATTGQKANFISAVDLIASQSV